MKKAAKGIAFALISVMLVMILSACATPNKDPKKAKNALEDNGYSVSLIDGTIAASQYKGCECYILAKDAENSTVLLVYYFRSNALANDVWDELSKEDAQAALERSEDTEVIMRKSGAMIYFGTKEAIKAAK